MGKEHSQRTYVCEIYPANSSSIQDRFKAICNLSFRSLLPIFERTLVSHRLKLFRSSHISTPSLAHHSFLPVAIGAPGINTSCKTNSRYHTLAEYLCYLWLRINRGTAVCFDFCCLEECLGAKLVSLSEVSWAFSAQPDRSAQLSAMHQFCYLFGNRRVLSRPPFLLASTLLAAFMCTTQDCKRKCIPRPAAPVD
jgi:hypothetical protein